MLVPGIDIPDTSQRPGVAAHSHRTGRQVGWKLSTAPPGREPGADLAREVLGEAGLDHVRHSTDSERRGLEVRLEVVAGQHDDRNGRGHGATLELSDRGPAVELRP